MNPSSTLILTNSADTTSDYLCDELLSSGINFIRFNTDQHCRKAILTYKNETPNLQWADISLYPSQVSAVILRRPEMPETRLQGDYHTKKHVAGEWSEALEGFLAHIDEKLWVNHPSRNCMASHKIEQLTRAKNSGLRIPATLVSNHQATIKNFIHSQGEVIVKPLASGFIERENGDSIIYTQSFQRHHYHLLEKNLDCPVLFQKRVHKALDVRVTALDKKLIAVGMKADGSDGIQRLDIRRNNMIDVEYSVIDIPPIVSTSIKFLLDGYHLRFAAIDFCITNAGEWYFFEINPNGQWAWLDIYANAGISKAFTKTLGDCLNV